MSIKLRPYQEKAIDMLYDYMRSNDGNPCLVLPCGCHAKGTPILTYDGDVKAVEDIMPGDLLIGPDSRPRTVNHLCRGNGDMFRIAPIKGDSFIVNGDHILSLIQIGKGAGIVNISVREYLSKSQNWKNTHKLYRSGVEDCWNKQNHKIPPYIMGLLLGDGNFGYASVGLTTIDDEILDEWLNYLDSVGCYFSIQENKHKTCPTYNAKTIGNSYYGGAKKGMGVLQQKLRYYGLMGCTSGTKFIPKDYKIGTVKNRLEILAGILDADGCMQNSGFDYISKSKTLSEDVAFICRSLGLSAYIKKCIKRCQNNFSGEYYRVSISGECSIIPCRLPRKQAPRRRQVKRNWVTGFSIEPVGTDDYYGFNVSDDHLYLMGDFTVTHNSGKSIIVSSICTTAIKAYPLTRILMLTHVKELIQQNANKLLMVWPDAPLGIYSASIGQKNVRQITYAGIQSIARTPEKIGHTDIVIIDEAHLVSHKQTGQYRSLISYLKSINDKMVVIGLTATPWRLSHGLITDGDTIFDDIIEPVSIMELIDDGYLAPLRSKDTDTKIDISGVHKRGGEFINSELQKASDTNENNIRIAKEIVARAGDRKKWLVFCTGVDHAKHMSECLNALGVKSEYVHGGTKDKERDRILSDHYSGRITALVNVQVLSTGYDSPNVDLIAMVRTTLSLGLYFQITGRGTRLKDHTDHCLVLDFAGNVSIHGPITDPVLPRKKGNGTGKAPIKLCTICSEILHASARKCTCCGFEFPKVDKLAKMRFHNDDIMGIELNDMEIRSWHWELFRSKKGNDMIRCRYSPKNLNDEPIIEYLAILNDGPAGAIAKNKLVRIAKSAKVIIKNADNRSDLCRILSDGCPPSIIRWRKNKKYKSVIEREWL